MVDRGQNLIGAALLDLLECSAARIQLLMKAQTHEVGETGIELKRRQPALNCLNSQGRTERLLYDPAVGRPFG